jgi:formate hydrogenlyase subunit 4
MSGFFALAAQVLHILLILAAAPLAEGVIGRLSALLTGRSGPPVLQPLWDLFRLMSKSPATQENASPVSRFAPSVAFGATLSAAVLVPSFAAGMASSYLADGLTIVALLALAQVALALAALDIGPPSAGLAQQSDTPRTVLSGIVLLLAVAAPGILAGTTNLDRIAVLQRDGLLLPASASAAAFAALLAVPWTEREDAAPMFGGTDLALVLAAGWLRRLVWIGLTGALFLPIGMGVAARPQSWAAGAAVWSLKLILGILLFAGLPALLGRPLRRDIPAILAVACLIALMAAALAFAGGGAP